jgi:hypothetical protein
MKTEKKKGKRGRPRKHPIKTETEPTIKRSRGRPPKVQNLENIEIKNVAELPAEEIYIEPKIHRNIRVFRFDRSVFHALSKKFDGDIIIMSYVVNRLMEMYINKKIKLQNKNNYYKWCDSSPLLEPVGFNDLAQAHAVSRGVPLQYKYNLIIDREVFHKFEKDSECYPQYLLNSLVKMYLDSGDKISIDIRKANGWCNFG